MLGPAGRPDAGAIEKAPAGLSPLNEPIPPPGLTIIPPEPVKPVRPAPLPPSPLAQRMLEFSNLRGIDEFRRKQAEGYVQREEAARKEEEARRLDDYHNQRSIYDDAVKTRDKIIREMPKEMIDDLYKRAQLAVIQAKTPLELEKAKQDLVKLDLDIQKARQELVEPKIHTVEGKLYERAPGSPAGTPVTPVAGVLPSEKMNETQQKTYLGFTGAMVAHEQMGDQDIQLLNLPASIWSKVPVAGNYNIDPRFRQAKNTMDTWLLRNVRTESGASIRPDEIPFYYPKYAPIPGDDAAEVERKRERRDETNAALYGALGDVKDPADKFLERRFKANEERDPVTVRTPAEAKRLPPGTRFYDTNGVLRQAPRRSWQKQLEK